MCQQFHSRACKGKLKWHYILPSIHNSSTQQEEAAAHNSKQQQWSQVKESVRWKGGEKVTGEKKKVLPIYRRYCTVYHDDRCWKKWMHGAQVCARMCQMAFIHLGPQKDFFAAKKLSKGWNVKLKMTFLKFSKYLFVIKTLYYFCDIRC